MSQTEPVAELNESFSQPGVSAPPWTGPSPTVLVFGVRPAKILAFGKAPYTQTRYRFPA